MNRRGFTVIELLAVIEVVVVVGALLMVSTTRTRCCGCRSMKDSTQVRGMVTGMIVWAGNNKGEYPLPSVVDAAGATVSEGGIAKDTTGNILSMMIYAGMLSPEILISPAESNTGQVQRYDAYSYEKPSAAVDPLKALWDPSFRGTPVDAPVGGVLALGVGNQSYGHMIPVGKRRGMWTDNFAAMQPVIGNRGPGYCVDDVGRGRGEWTLLPGPLGTSSNTLLIHGGRSTWEGNIGFNDNHVEFVGSAVVAGVTYQRRSATVWRLESAPDNLFVNDSDEEGGDGFSGGVGKGVNAYLRPVARVGESGVRVWRD